MRLRKAWVDFNNLRTRMAGVPTSGVIPPLVNAALPAPSGILNPAALKDAIATAEYGEYRGNCLYCHRQNWCGVSHKSIYCPFRLITMHPGKIKNFLGEHNTVWPAGKTASSWHRSGNFLRPCDLYFVYRYLRDNKHCFICEWPCEWIMPHQQMVTHSSKNLWAAAYKDTSNVGHCTLDCPQMAPWDILVGRMAELSKNADGGDMGLADNGNELADCLQGGLIKPEANADNPVTAFLGAGMVMPHLLGKTAGNKWRVLALEGGKDRIFPWNVPADGESRLGAYIESILAVATFLRTGRIDSARVVLFQANSPLRQLVQQLGDSEQTGDHLLGAEGKRTLVCPQRVKLQSLGWGQRPDTRG